MTFPPRWWYSSIKPSAGLSKGVLMWTISGRGRGRHARSLPDERGTDENENQRRVHKYADFAAAEISASHAARQALHGVRRACSIGLAVSGAPDQGARTPAEKT